MSQQQPAPQGKDPVLWEIAQKRAGFKSHAISYLIVISFLWAIWYFTGGGFTGVVRWNHYPWPIWPTLGWGLGLAFHFAGAFVFPHFNSVERAYQRLKNNQSPS